MRYNKKTKNMRTDFYIQSGQVITSYTNTPAGLFSLTKFFKKMLIRFNIAYLDTCCTADETFLPMRYNKTSAKLQYFDDVTKVWINLTTF